MIRLARSLVAVVLLMCAAHPVVLAQSSVVEGCFFYLNGTTCSGSGWTVCPGGPYDCISYLFGEFSNDLADPELVDPFHLTFPAWDPSPSSPVLGINGALLAEASLLDPALSDVCFAGAIEGPSGDWTLGWTYYDRNGGTGRTDIDYGRPLILVSGSIVSTTSWDAANNYQLVGRVTVTPGAELIIEPGTVIFGTDPTSHLVVEMGARIDAQGTALEPIIFTSAQPTGSMAAGDWGGLILNGQAVGNCAGSGCGTTSLSSPCLAIDGSIFGGSDDLDDSGVLRYVRIEYAGGEFVSGYPIGLRLNAVGSTTQLEFGQVHECASDGFAFAGGTVVGRHLVSTGNQDDCYDFDAGYRGALQFCVGQQAQTPSGPDCGIESNNNGLNYDCLPRTDPKLSNLTLVGTGLGALSGEDGLLFQSGSNVQLVNSIVLGFRTDGFDVRDRFFCPGPVIDAVCPSTGLLSRAEALQIALDQVILLHPLADSLVAMFHRYTAPIDSVLTPGDSVTPEDSSFAYDVLEPTYFFWLDLEPSYEFAHATEFVFVNAVTGAIEQFTSEWWPLLDGETIVFEDGDVVFGDYPVLAECLPYYVPVSRPPSKEWAMVVLGKNGGGSSRGRANERKARQNDLQCVLEILNGAPLGPKLPIGNITVLTGLDTLGATKAELCGTIDLLANAGECDKFHFYYLGHGERSYIVTDEGKTTYEELAAKLESLDAKRFCIALEACHSGAGLDVLADSELDGEAVSSAAPNRTTKRLSGGTPFISSLKACTFDPVANVNGDSVITLIEAVSWAREENAAVQNDDAQAVLLGQGREVDFGSKSPRTTKDDASGVNRDYVRRKVWIKVKKTRARGARDSVICRTLVYVTNYDFNNAIDDPHEVEFLCDGEVIATAKVQVPKAAKGRLPDSNVPFMWYGTACLAELPEDCRNFQVRRKSGSLRAPAPKASATGLDDVLDQRVERSPIYRAGDFVFQELLIPNTAGQSFSASVIEQPSGWNLAANPPSMLVSPTLDSAYVLVAGDVPDTATRGGIVDLAVVRASADTTWLTLSALIAAEAPGGLTGGQHSFQELRTPGMLVIADTLELDNVLLALPPAAGALILGPGGTLVWDAVTVVADTTGEYTFNASGELDWDQVDLVSPQTGLRLNQATGLIEFGAVTKSAGDGVYMSGDLGDLSLDYLLVDSPAGNGLVLDGTSHTLVRGLRIENAGGLDIVASNGADAELWDCAYDDAQESIEAGSEIRRTWTTELRLTTHLGDPVRDVIVTVEDALGDTVAIDTSDASGWLSTLFLEQYVQAGALRTVKTPHVLNISSAFGDTAMTYAADTVRVLEVVMTSPATSVEPQPHDRFQLAQNTPNPVRGKTTIHYTLANDEMVELQVFDLAGRLVATLVSARQRAGRHEVAWQTGGIPSGLYFYRLGTRSGGVLTRRMTVLE